MADREKVIKGLKIHEKRMKRTGVSCLECPYAEAEGGTDDWCICGLHRDILALLKEQEPIVGWISVKDRLPEEHPSMFYKLYGTDIWARAMWRTESDRVLVTIKFPDGTRTVDMGILQDGAWRTGVSPVIPQEVPHWALWPEPPKEDETDAGT